MRSIIGLAAKPFRKTGRERSGFGLTHLTKPSFTHIGKPAPDSPAILLRTVPWPEPDIRKAEIIAAYDAWQVESEVVGRSVGLDDTNALPDAFYKKIRPMEERVIEMPAKTLEGFRAKARAVVSSYSTPEELEEEFTNTSVSHEIAWSLISNLVHLA